MLSFEKIKKIDYILVFVCGLLGAIILIFAVVDFISSLNWFSHEPRIDIVDIAKNPDAKIKENIDFYQKVRDCYVFSIKTNAVRSDELEDFQTASDVFSKSESMARPENIANYIFVKVC